MIEERRQVVGPECVVISLVTREPYSLGHQKSNFIRNLPRVFQFDENVFELPLDF